MRFALTQPSGLHDELVPERTRLAGYAALVSALNVQAPLRHFGCVSDGHVHGTTRRDGRWTVYDKRYWPGDGFGDHLSFALRHEHIDLLILKRVFSAIDPADMANFIRSAPTGAPNRRAWFLYETLTGRKLGIPDADRMSAVDLLDPKAYYTAPATLSRRHRVRDNLLGNNRFCPVIRRTEALEEYLALDLREKARDTVGKTGRHLIARAASFLLLADSRASFEIEGERPPRSRLERWGKAVLQAGRNPLNQAEIQRLHRILIEDDRLTPIGYRTEGVFLGERDRSGEPNPEFIGARPEDVPDIMKGLGECNDRLGPSGLDPVLQAAAIAFGFVYIHPLQDGNGRLHRCLVHHVLAERKFTPPGMVFPVSSVMLDRIEAYKQTLQSHSAPLMDFIEWRPTANRNVEVTNDTADLYRYFDCTAAAEFLYACVRRAVEHDLPREIDYLHRHDLAMRRIMDKVEMPDRLAEDFIMFLRQNGGKLPERRRRKEFGALTDDETAALEQAVNEAFDGFEGE
jgi:hypothetical protein